MNYNARMWWWQSSKIAINNRKFNSIMAAQIVVNKNDKKYKWWYDYIRLYNIMHRILIHYTSAEIVDT